MFNKVLYENENMTYMIIFANRRKIIRYHYYTLLQIPEI